MPNENTAIQVLTSHWSKIFPEITFQYDEKSVFTTAAQIMCHSSEFKGGSVQSLMKKEIFFHYNVFAEDLLIRLYGETPRILKS